MTGMITDVCFNIEGRGTVNRRERLEINRTFDESDLHNTLRATPTRVSVIPIVIRHDTTQTNYSITFTTTHATRANLT